MFSRTGDLNANDPSRVDWSNSINIGHMPVNAYPAVTNSNIEALATWTVCSGIFCTPGTLQYTNTPVK
jgi:hypothetical protein